MSTSNIFVFSKKDQIQSFKERIRIALYCRSDHENISKCLNSSHLSGVKSGAQKLNGRSGWLWGCLSPHCLMLELFVKNKGANILKQVISRNCNLWYNVQNNQPLLFFVWTQEPWGVSFQVPWSCWKAAWSAGQWTCVRPRHRVTKVAACGPYRVTHALLLWNGIFLWWECQMAFQIIQDIWQPLSPEPLFLENLSALW